MKKKLLAILGLTLVTTTINAQSPNGLDFDGVDDYVVIPSLTDSILSNWTVECWIKSPQAPNASNFSGPVYGENMGLIWNHLGSSFQGAATVRDAGGNYYAASFSPLSSDTWYHLAATYDGNVLRSYKNGVMIAEVTTLGGMSTSPLPLTLGKHPTLGEYFNGTIDDLRIWTVARSCIEINNTMNISLIGTESGLVVNYKMDQGITAGNNSSLTSLNDLTASNNGTLNNFSLTGSASNFISGAPFNNAINACGVSVDEITDEALISLYPNPATSTIHISTKNKIDQISMYNLTGELQQIAINPVNLISVAQLPPGMYIVYIQTADGISIKHFVKE